MQHGFSSAQTDKREELSTVANSPIVLTNKILFGDSILDRGDCLIQPEPDFALQSYDAP